MNKSICEDLSSEAAIQSVIKKIKAADTPLDAIIHCAGVRVMNDIIYTPGEDLMKLEAATSSTPYGGWEKSFQVNVMAPYFLTAGLISLLGAAASKGDGRGCVIIFSSPASVHNHQFVPCYQTSKAAVDHLVRIMAAEFADFYSKFSIFFPSRRVRQTFSFFYHLTIFPSSSQFNLTWNNTIGYNPGWRHR